MGIRSFIEKHFKKSITSLLRVDSSFEIPVIESYLNDQPMLDLIAQYKQEYIDRLSEMKYSDINILSASDLSNDISMSVELLTKTYLSHDDEIRLRDEKDRIEDLIKEKKFKLYFEDIVAMQREAIARFLALKEIYEERKSIIFDREAKFLERRKVQVIDNEVNNLVLSLQTLKNQRIGIAGGQRYFWNKAVEGYTEDDYDIEKEKKYLREKRRNLFKWQSVLPDGERLEIREDKEYILEDIATLEKKLEIYVYKHKDEIEKIREELNKLYATYRSVFGIDTDNLRFPQRQKDKEVILAKLDELEIKFRLFYEYGRNLVEEIDLADIYNLKFGIQTISENGICEVFVDDNTDSLELEYYQKIIFRMIEEIITGRNEIFQNTFKEDVIEAINLFKELMKQGKDKFEEGAILNDKYLLNLLLSFEFKAGLYNFYNNYKVSEKGGISVGFSSKSDQTTFKFTQEVPLSTYFYFNEWLQHHFQTSYNFYKLFMKNVINNEYYYLPEGIVEINISIKVNSEETNILNKIREEADGKVVITPPSLRSITGDLFKGVQILGIKLNEGFQELGSYALISQKLSSITLPSTITEVGEYALNNKAIETIYFENFEESIFAHFDKGKKIVVSSNYKYGRCFSYDHLVMLLFNFVYKKDNCEDYYIYDIGIDVDFVLKNNSSNDITIKRSELTIHKPTRLNSNYINISDTKRAILIVDKFRALAKEKAENLEAYKKSLKKD